MRVELEQRTQAQLRYYWSVIVPSLSRLWHLDVLEAHDRIKDQFNGSQSVAALTTVRFEQLMERLRAYGERRYHLQILPPQFTGRLKVRGR